MARRSENLVISDSNARKAMLGASSSAVDPRYGLEASRQTGATERKLFKDTLYERYGLHSQNPYDQCETLA